MKESANMKINKHYSIYLVLLGLLTISIGLNFLFYNRINILQQYIIDTNPINNTDHLNLMKKEIERLEKTKYQIIQGE